MTEVKERIEIPARTGWSAKLDEGQQFRIIDVEGGQAADLFVYNAANPIEYMSGRHTRVYMDEMYPAGRVDLLHRTSAPPYSSLSTTPRREGTTASSRPVIHIDTGTSALSQGTRHVRRTSKRRRRSMASTSRMPHSP